MAKTKLEYIWLDGYTPTQSLRSKTKIVRDFDGTWKVVRAGHLMAVLPSKPPAAPQIVC